MNHYTYVYWVSGVPEYVGKGTGTRALRHCKGRARSSWARRIHAALSTGEAVRVELPFWGSHEEALAEETALIAKYGRRDLGTGTLYNLTDGGEGSARCIPSDETRRRLKAANRTISPDDIAEIRRRFDGGEKQASIRRDFPMSHTLMSLICRRVRYTDL